MGVGLGLNTTVASKDRRVVAVAINVVSQDCSQVVAESIESSVATQCSSVRVSDVETKQSQNELFTEQDKNELWEDGVAGVESLVHSIQVLFIFRGFSVL